MKRVVLDTNVFISGIFWKGLPREIIDLGRDREIEIITSNEIVDEVRDKLISKFLLSEEEADFFIFDILTYSRVFEISLRVKVIKDDPEDDKFIECAISCGAKYIVSGDHHLVDLSFYKGVQILKPDQFLSKISKK